MSTGNNDSIWDQVVNPDTISEYEDSRVNWDFFFKCQAETRKRVLPLTPEQQSAMCDNND
jgi:hypothetical protein